MASTVLYRSRLSPTTPFAELMRAEADSMVENSRHRVPIACLVENLFPELYRERTELAQVQLDYLPSWQQAEDERSVSARPLVGRGDNFQFELCVDVGELDNAWVIDLAHNSLAVDEGFVTELGRSMQAVIDRVLRAPGTRLDELPAER